MKLQRIGTSVVACVVLSACAGDAPPETSSAGGSPPTAAAQAPAAQQMPGRVIETDGGQYRDIIVPELQAMLASKDFTMVNVHVPFAGDLPATDASIRYDEIASHLDQLPADKNAKIVLYCRTGPMSTRAAQDLVRLGYTNVYNLVGGFSSWVEAGLPLAAN